MKRMGVMGEEKKESSTTECSEEVGLNERVEGKSKGEGEMKVSSVLRSGNERKRKNVPLTIIPAPITSEPRLTVPACGWKCTSISIEHCRE